MEWIFWTVGLVVFGASVLAAYEWKTQRTLLKHDLNLQGESDANTLTATVQAEDATLHRISGFDR